MNYGHLSLRRQINPGYGLRYAERPDQSLLERLATEVKKPVVSYGITFQKYIAKDIVIQIFGKHIRRLFQKSSIQQWGRKQVKQLMSSDGIIHSGSVWEDLFAKHFLSPNLRSCILPAWTSFSIATIWKRPSAFRCPLPVFVRYQGCWTNLVIKAHQQDDLQ